MKIQALPFVLLAPVLGAVLSCSESEAPKLPPMPDRSAPERPAPKAWLEAERTEEDFGVLYQNTVAGTSFSMQAAGEEDLIVAQLTHECGCTDAELYVLDGEQRSEVELLKPYPPGTRFELDAQLNTKGKHGEQHQDLGILLGEEGLDLKLFTLTAVVEPYLVAEPAVLNFERVAAVQGVKDSTVLRARDGSRFGVRIWREILCEGIEAELTPLDAGDDGRASEWRLDVDVLPGNSGQSLLCRLLLETDVPNELAKLEEGEEVPMHRSEFQVAAQIEPVMKAWPERVNFGTFPADKTAVERFIIRNEDPTFDLTGLRIALADAEDPTQAFAWHEHATFTAEPMEDSQDWQVRLQLENIPEPGPFSGVVLIDVGHPFQRHMTVPFGGAVGAP